MMRAECEMDKWDARFFELCGFIAAWSEDRRRKIGALIVGPANEIRSLGFNGLPRGVSGERDDRHRPDEREKYYWFEHAERNAIYNAARAGTSTEGCRIYVSLFPCADCTRAIIQSGIAQVNTFPPPKNDEMYDRSFDVALTMLEEAGLELRLFRPPASSASSQS